MTTASARDWRAVGEVGAAWGIGIVVACCRLLGRRVTGLLLKVIALYYVATSARVRRTSTELWRRLGVPAGFRRVRAHVETFAQVTLDRLLFASGETRSLEVVSHGHEHLAALAGKRRGALLLGAHLGSFEALRAAATQTSLPVTIVADFGNARLINGVLERINPGLNTRVLSVADGGVDAVLRARECIDRGELVAVLADRVRPDMRSIDVDLLGGRARLPAAPFVLAAALGCPVLLTFGLFRGGSRYDLICEPFADRIELERRDRAGALAAVGQRFAARLEHYVREQPDNWFNFYDYWT